MNRRVTLAVLVVMGMLGAAALLAQRALQEPLRLPATGFLLDVPAGSSLQAVTTRLNAEGILPYPLILQAYGRITGLAPQIKAGEYEIAQGTTPLVLIQLLVEGRVKLHSLTIVEGWSTVDLLRAIRKNKMIEQTLPTKGDISMLAGLELPSASPEGWFFPDTYRFPRGTSDREVLLMAHERMKAVLAKAWSGRSADLPIQSEYEALILASIVEKETALDRERANVAGVFVRRLKAGMRLQTDPTVIYGLGEQFDGDLTRRQLMRDGPYNTYTRAGLPPTPISLPGESSLLAAVHPDRSDALYFVASADQDGSHVFSSTLRDHNAAVRRYLAANKEPDK